MMLVTGPRTGTFQRTSVTLVLSLVVGLLMFREIVMFREIIYGTGQILTKFAPWREYSQELVTKHADGIGSLLNNETNSTISSTRASIPQQVFLIPNRTNLEGVDELRATTSKLKVSPLEHCAPTTQIQLQIFNASLWILQSLDEEGNKKTIGGDEFYISYRDYGNPNWSDGGDATAVAI
jgi:hypothetical protein